MNPIVSENLEHCLHPGLEMMGQSVTLSICAHVMGIGEHQQTSQGALGMVLCGRPQEVTSFP